MNFKKLLVCMLIGFLAFNFSNIKAFAAEDVTTIPEQDSKIQDTTAIPSEDNKVEAVNQEQTSKVEETKEDQIVLASNTEKDTSKEKSTKTKETSEKKTTKTVKKIAVNYTKAELRLLSALIYCEANAESYNGKLAVAIVVMNRTRANIYPDTVKGVIYQKYQFSPVRNGSLNRALAEYDRGRFNSADEKECIQAAKAALSGTKNLSIKGKVKNFSKYLSFSGSLHGYTYKIDHHKFK